MKAKIIRGKNFGGVLNYVLGKEQSQLIGGNLSGTTIKELKLEFNTIKDLRPDIQKPVWHSSLSLPQGEHLQAETWESIAANYLKKMGFSESNPYIVVRHSDTQHDHIHIVVSRIGLDSQVWHGTWEARKAIEATQALEREHGLTQTPGFNPEHRAERKKATHKELNQAIRTQKAPTRSILQILASAAAHNSQTLSDYADKLSEVDVELIPMYQKEGEKLVGLSYKHQDIIIKGSNLGKAYTPKGLERQGITYEKDRDFRKLSPIQQHQDRTKDQPTDRTNEKQENPECRRTGRNNRTDGPSDGTPERRNQTNPERKPRTMQNPGQDEPRHTEEHGTPKPSHRPPDPKPLWDRHTERSPYDNARERIMALAYTAEDQSTHRPRSHRTDHSKRDRSLEAIQKSLQALNCERYTLGIRDQKTGQMLQRNWHTEDILNHMGWLKRMNAQGNDIYIQPAGQQHALILMDDLKPSQLNDLKKAGLPPALSLETSPNNYQAWIRLAEHPLSPEIRKYMAQSLAKEFNADPNSAGSQHYGRLAGFTNQKPKYTQEGRQPYVTLHETSRTVGFGAQERLQKAQAILEQHKPPPRHHELPRASTSTATDPIQEYKRQTKTIMARYGQDTDLSRLDWMITVSMLKSGQYTPEQVKQVLIECSPNLSARKTGHIEDYANRTVEKAWQSKEVQHKFMDRGDIER